MSSDPTEVVEQALGEIDRYIAKAQRGERHELAIQVHERYSEKAVTQITDDELLLLQAVVSVYERQANWEESSWSDDWLKDFSFDDESVGQEISKMLD